MHNTKMSSYLDTEKRSVSRPIADAMGRPLHDLRISLLDQCNFRCPYCMPEAKFHADYEFLKRQQRLTYDEILRVAAGASSLGVSKIRLTGGEPLLDKKICDLVERIVMLPGVDDLALTIFCYLVEGFKGRACFVVKKHSVPG